MRTIVSRLCILVATLAFLAACETYEGYQQPTGTRVGTHAPDLSGLGYDIRQSIELACIGEKVKGPAPYINCLNAQLSSIRGNQNAPDLSGLGHNIRQSIELACIGEKTKGPAPYINCLNAQLTSIGVIAN